MSEQLIGLVGDVLIDRQVPNEVFADVQDILAAPDVLFANLEGVYTDNPHVAPSASLVIGPSAKNLEAFSSAGFNVMSLANNHVLDVGYQAMLETRAWLRARGIQTCGAGRNLADARRPAIITASGVRIAFLGYASDFRPGYEARSTRAGLVPIREHRYWFDSHPFYFPGRTFESVGMPNGESFQFTTSPPPVVTMPDVQDLEGLTQDIITARRQADVVIASFHWGNYFCPFTLTEHERRTARHAVDCGADLVVGHHHHVLRGIEWYKDRPILYGLGHFVFDLRMELDQPVQRAVAAIAPDSYEVAPREGWPLLPFHADARMNVLAWAKVAQSKIVEVGFLPCHLSSDGLVHPAPCDSERGAEIIRYMEKCNEVPSLNGRIVSSELRLGGHKTMQVVPLS